MLLFVDQIDTKAAQCLQVLLDFLTSQDSRILIKLIGIINGIEWLTILEHRQITIKINDIVVTPVLIIGRIFNYLIEFFHIKLALIMLGKVSVDFFVTLLEMIDVAITILVIVNKQTKDHGRIAIAWRCCKKLSQAIGLFTAYFGGNTQIDIAISRHFQFLDEVKSTFA
ncbi:hypothetical protein DAA48_21190 [Aeromonas veronii]|uniref:Uncharacterized protein n=1 Tax=Aeromonas veronii TaxID=654 RepID=A0A2T4MWU2_AERVE|nr:hypothetical protein DAA48_21190 [Aeromonas veronii]